MASNNPSGKAPHPTSRDAISNATSQGHPGPQPAPSPWIARFAPLVPAGPVLDLACGGGRHGRLFLERGHPVLFLDRDPGGVADLATNPLVEIIATDLEDGSPWPLAGRQFSAVLVANYLHRPLWEGLIGCLAPDGVLIYETFAKGNERFGRPRNPDHLLEPGELLAVAARAGLTVLAYEYGIRPAGQDAFRVIEHLCAMHDTNPRPLNP